MFGCSFVQAPWIYCISSAGETAGVTLGKDIRVPLPSCAVLRILETEYPFRKTMRISRSARVTELLGILGIEVAPMLTHDSQP